MPKISIIIPVYNAAPYLHKSMDSVINQTFSDLEIICVNDCSPDNSLEILEEYASKDDRIKIINLEKNSGTGRVRNIGLETATGDYIMFLDPDDWYDLSVCELAYNQITKNKNDFVDFNFYHYFEKTGKVKWNNKKFEVILNLKNQGHVNYDDLTIPYKTSALVWHKIYNHEFLKKYDIKFQEGIGFEDTLFHAKTFCYAQSISVINKPLYYYRKRSNSGVHSPLNIKEIPVTCKIVIDNLPKNLTQIRYDSLICQIVDLQAEFYKRLCKKCPELKEYYFKAEQELIQKIDKESVMRVKDYIDYDRYYAFINSKTYQEYDQKLQLLKYRKICKIERKKDYTRVYFCGINFKIRKLAKASC